MTKKVPGAREGQVPHQPTDERRELVRTLYVAGWTQAKIGALPDINCSDDTLRKYYRNQLDAGKAVVDARVTQSIVMMAIGGPKRDWTKASASMASFYAKTRMGWKDRTEINHTGSVGLYDLSKISDADLQRISEILGRAEISATPGDTGGDSET